MAIYELTSFEESIEITECTYNAETNELVPKFNVNSVDDGEETVIIAIYAANGILTKVLTENKEFAALGNDTVNIDISSVPAGEYTYNVMVWNNLSGQIPEAKAYHGNLIISE